MKDKNDKIGFLPKENFYNGLAFFFAICGSILFYLFLSQLNSVLSFFGKILEVLTPIFAGLIIAYLLNPISSFVCEKCKIFFLKKFKKQKTAVVFSKILGVLAATVFLLLIIFAAMMLIIPNVVKSVTNLVTDISNNYTVYIDKVNSLFGSNETFKGIVDQAFNYVNNWINTGFLSNASKVLTTVYNGAVSFVGFLANAFISFIIAIYALYNKDLFKAQTKKTLNAIFSKNTVDDILLGAKKTDEIFGGFITAKLIDSAIIGVLCFIGVTLLGYRNSSVLVATIVGVTNIIPFFGPLIGAIPSAFIVWFTEGDIMKALYFVIFVILLQQLDGNVIGPKIVGERTGLSSFWVLIAITVFGGFFGIAGMIFGVPCFALIYFLASYLIRKQLRKKGLPEDSGSYLSDSGTDNTEENNSK